MINFRWLKVSSIALTVAFAVGGVSYAFPKVKAGVSQKAVGSTKEHGQGQVRLDSPDSPEAITRQISRLNEVIKNHPKNTDALVQRATMYAILHDYKRALGDLRAAEKIHALYPSAKIGLCMLSERLHGQTSKVKRCYQSVVSTYKQLARGKSKIDPNYVVAALMAKAPNAEKLRDMYLKQEKRGSLLRSVIKDFRRSEFLNTIYPKKVIRRFQ